MHSTSLPTRQFETGAAPQAAVIWLHGFGSTAESLMTVALRVAGQLGDRGVRCIFPQAPSIGGDPDDGPATASWYRSVHTDAGRVADPVSLQASRQAIEALIDEQVARGIAAERIVLAGFSQGCAMVLHTGLRFPRRIGGMMALSGLVRQGDSLRAERHSSNLKTPIFMAHGVHDDRIPLQQAESARALLQSLDYPIEWHLYDMGHCIEQREIEDIGIWLNRVLAA